MPAADSPLEPDTHYRLAPALVWRVVGAQLIAFGVGLLGVVAVVALADLPVLIAVVTLLLGFLVTTGTAWWLRSRASVVSLSAQGYDVRLLRGVGLRAASWSQVKEVVTTSPHGVAMVVLRLDDGRETAIPVAALAGDRAELVRDLQRRLQTGRGLKRL